MSTVNSREDDTGYKVSNLIGEDARITTLGLQGRDNMILFNEMLDEEVLYEATKSNNGILKKLLYQSSLAGSEETGNNINLCHIYTPICTKSVL